VAGGTVFAAGGKEEAAPQVIKIGAAVSLTGSLARFGEMVKSGYELWEKTVNAQGGINVGGKKIPVQVIIYDDQSDNAVSAKLTEKLITEDQVQFLLGPYGSGATFATTAIAEKYNIITIATLANASKIYERGFQNVSPSSPREPGSLQLHRHARALSPKPTKIAIITPNDLFPFPWPPAQRNTPRRRDSRSSTMRNTPREPRSLSTILKIKNSAPRSFSFRLSRGAILTMRQLREQQVALKASASPPDPSSRISGTARERR
jgi:branched-chain amino acid transport system substrate-binding protein